MGPYNSKLLLLASVEVFMKLVERYNFDQFNLRQFQSLAYGQFD